MKYSRNRNNLGITLVAGVLGMFFVISCSGVEKKIGTSPEKTSGETAEDGSASTEDSPEEDGDSRVEIQSTDTSSDKSDLQDGEDEQRELTNLGAEQTTKDPIEEVPVVIDPGICLESVVDGDFEESLADLWQLSNASPGYSELNIPSAIVDGAREISGEETGKKALKLTIPRGSSKCASGMAHRDNLIEMSVPSGKEIVVGFWTKYNADISYAKAEILFLPLLTTIQRESNVAAGVARSSEVSLTASEDWIRRGARWKNTSSEELLVAISFHAEIDVLSSYDGSCGDNLPENMRDEVLLIDEFEIDSCGVLDFCGDESTHPVFEQCDDGNSSISDSCLPNCRKNVCGDRIINQEFPDDMSGLEAFENCDDGNKESGDGCSKTCQIEEDWTCWANGKLGSLCSLCGEGMVGRGTECKDLGWSIDPNSDGSISCGGFKSLYSWTAEHDEDTERVLEFKMSKNQDIDFSKISAIEIIHDEDFYDAWKDLEFEIGERIFSVFGDPTTPEERIRDVFDVSEISGEQPVSIVMKVRTDRPLRPHEMPMTIDQIICR